MYDELIRQMMACCKGVPCEDANCGFNPKSDLDCIEQLLTRAADAIEKLQKRKRGKWIYQFHEDEVGVTCSECEGYAESFARWIYDEGYRIDYNYCPNCGAEMECADDV